MKLFIYFIIYFISFNSFGLELKEFLSGETIKASDLNYNLNKFNYFFNPQNHYLFLSGNIIDKNSINSKIGSLVNCNSTQLNSDKIKAEDFNSLFSSISCEFPNQNQYDIDCDCFKNINYVKNDNTSWIIDGDLNTGIGFLNLDIYTPVNKNGKVVFYFHSLTNTKELNTWFPQEIKNTFVNLGYIFISVEFRHPAVEGYFSLNDQFDIAKAVSQIGDLSYFLGFNKEEIYGIGYSKGTLSLANFIDQRISDYSSFNFKKLYLLDAQVTFNENKYHELFLDKNTVSYGFIQLSSQDAFSLLNSGTKSFVGIELINDLGAVDSFLSVENNLNMSEKIGLPSLRLAYNYKDKGLINIKDVMPSIFPLEINYNEMDYLLHNPHSINKFCEIYSLYANCSGVDDLNFNGLNIINDMVNFIHN